MSRGRLIHFPAKIVLLATVLGGLCGAQGGPSLPELVANAKPNPHALVSARYLGGRGFDHAWAIAVDSEGFVYVAGNTDSEDFPTTEGALQPHYNAPCVRTTPDSTCQFFGFLTKLAPDGKTIVFSTYLGNPGGQSMIPSQIAFGPDGTIYLAGTARGSLPVTPGAYQPTCNSRIACVFVAKLDRTGSRLEYATYLSGSVSDYPLSLKIDSRGRAWLSGSTNSVDFPKTPDAFQSRIGGGFDDAFIAVLSSDGGALEYATLLGGAGSEGVALVQFLSDDAAVFTGGTGSSDFPTTPDAYQSQFRGLRDLIYGALDIKHGLAYSTYLGDEREDFGSLSSIPESYILHRNSSGSRTAPRDARGFSRDLVLLELPALHDIPKTIVEAGFTGAYRIGVRAGTTSTLFLTILDQPTFPQPPLRYEVGWDRQHKRWTYAYSANLPAGYDPMSAGSAFYLSSRRSWAAVQLTRDAPSFEGDAGARPGGWDILVLQDDLNERKFRWLEETPHVNEVRPGHTLDIASPLAPEGTGHPPTVEISCATTSQELKCSVEPENVLLQEKAEVRLHIQRTASAPLPLAALLAAPLCAVLWPGTRRRRLIVVGSILFCSFTLQSCRGLLRESATVQLTARTQEQSVSTEFEVVLPK